MDALLVLVDGLLVEVIALDQERLVAMVEIGEIMVQTPTTVEVVVVQEEQLLDLDIV